MQEDNLLGDDQLNIDAIAADHLKETAKWAKFISIAGFIFSGLILVFAVYYYNLMTQFPFGRRYYTRYMLTVAVYIAVAVVWTITSIYQLKFASAMLAALETNDQQELQRSMANLKTYYRISGIVSILSLLLCLLGMLSLLAEKGM